MKLEVKRLCFASCKRPSKAIRTRACKPVSPLRHNRDRVNICFLIPPPGSPTLGELSECRNYSTAPWHGRGEEEKPKGVRTTLDSARDGLPKIFFCVWVSDAHARGGGGRGWGKGVKWDTSDSSERETPERDWRVLRDSVSSWKHYRRFGDSFMENNVKKDVYLRIYPYTFVYLDTCYYNFEINRLNKGIIRHTENIITAALSCKQFLSLHFTLPVVADASSRYARSHVLVSVFSLLAQHSSNMQLYKRKSSSKTFEWH